MSSFHDRTVWLCKITPHPYAIHHILEYHSRFGYQCQLAILQTLIKRKFINLLIQKAHTSTSKRIDINQPSHVSPLLLKLASHPPLLTTSHEPGVLSL
jgi:hypothetical protein